MSTAAALIGVGVALVALAIVVALTMMGPRDGPTPSVRESATRPTRFTRSP